MKAWIARGDDLLLSARGVILANRMLKRSSFWSVEEQNAYQLERCRRLFKASYENTDYYRELFWKHDFDPYRDLRELGDLTRVPVLTKPMARAGHARLLNARAADGALELRTSGTSGDVFCEVVSRSHWVMEQAVTWRHWSWAGYRPFDRMAILRSYVPVDGAPFVKIDRIRNFLYLSAYHLSAATARLYEQTLRNWQPRFLRGYPSSLYALARHAEAQGWRLKRLRAAFTASETLSAEYRRVIERVFEVPVFDWYGQAECTVTMNECEAHEGLHINTEYGVCELVEDAGLAPNERRIVATCLNNLAMPLIRYETGDIAEVGAPNECRCGRRLPLVRAIRGRADGMLTTPDGRRVPSVNFYSLFDSEPAVIGFQLIQTGPRHVDLVLDAPNLGPEERTRLKMGLRARLGPAMEIAILEGAPFVRSSDGKRQAVLWRQEQ